MKEDKIGESTSSDSTKETTTSIEVAGAGVGGDSSVPTTVTTTVTSPIVLDTPELTASKHQVASVQGIINDPDGYKSRKFWFTVALAAVTCLLVYLGSIPPDVWKDMEEVIFCGYVLGNLTALFNRTSVAKKFMDQTAESNSNKKDAGEE